MASTSFFCSVPVLVIFVASNVLGAVGDTQHSRAMQLGQQKGAEDGGGSGYPTPPISYVPPSGGYPSQPISIYIPPSGVYPSPPISYIPPSDGYQSPPISNVPPSDGYPTTGSPPYISTNPPYQPTPTVPMYPGSGGGYGTPTGETGHGSCRFWSLNHESWPDILSTISTISAIFGKSAASMFGGQMTLLQALKNSKSDAYSSLLREGTAALINSYAYKGFPFSPDVVKKKFGSGLKSSQAAAAQATEFARANTRIN